MDTSTALRTNGAARDFTDDAVPPRHGPRHPRRRPLRAEWREPPAVARRRRRGPGDPAPDRRADAAGVGRLRRPLEARRHAVQRRRRRRAGRRAARPERAGRHDRDRAGGAGRRRRPAPHRRHGQRRSGACRSPAGRRSTRSAGASCSPLAPAASAACSRRSCRAPSTRPPPGSGSPSDHALVATIFLGVPRTAGDEAAAGAGRDVRHAGPLRRPDADALNRQARRAVTAATTPPSTRASTRRTSVNPAPPTSRDRGTRSRVGPCRSRRVERQQQHRLLARAAGGPPPTRPASPAPGPAPRTAGRTVHRRTTPGPTRRTWPGRQRRRRRCVRSPRRSSRPTGRRRCTSRTSVGPARASRRRRGRTRPRRRGRPAAGRADRRRPRGASAAEYRVRAWPACGTRTARRTRVDLVSGRGGRTCARRRRTPPAARRRRSGHPCRARSTLGCP